MGNLTSSEIEDALEGVLSKISEPPERSSGPLNGENSPVAKLSEATVRSIWKDHLDGKKMRTIATAHAVSESRVWSITHGRTWTCVTGLNDEYSKYRNYNNSYRRTKACEKRKELTDRMCPLQIREDLPLDKMPRPKIMARFCKSLPFPLTGEDDRCIPYPRPHMHHTRIDRKIFEWFVGDLASNECVFRRCRELGNVNCVNPKHLSLRKNEYLSMKEMDSAGKRKREETE